MRPFSMILVLLAVALAAGTARAGAPGSMGATPGYWSCQSYVGSSTTVYFSGVFEGTGNQPVNAEFDQMLAKKYGFKGGGSCGIAWKSGTTIDKLKTDQTSAATQLRAQGRKVVETGWVFGGKSITYWCDGVVEVTGHGPVKYYSYATGTFDVPDAEAQSLAPAWHDYLKSQHPEAGALVNLANCTAGLPDPTKTQAQIQGWIDQYASQATISRTSWRYGQTPNP